MLPTPLHPLIVHFPVVLAVLLPISVLLALWAIRRGAAPRRIWPVPLAVAVALTASTWLAVRTGEAEEDRVEPIVGERLLHEHEEAGERLLVLSGILTLVAVGGLSAATAGAGARIVTLVGSAIVLVAGVQVGAKGGELVYVHGATLAYTEAPAAGDDREDRSQDAADDLLAEPTATRRREAADASGRAALPGLFAIMANLQADMTRLEQALWVEDYPMVATAARAIADHPHVPPDEAARIARVLGGDMVRFKALDGEVHDAAVRLSEHAARGEVEGVLTADAALRRGCVGCHGEFRERVREGMEER